VKSVASFARAASLAQALLFPRRWPRLRNFFGWRWRAASFPERVGYYPWSVDIEPTTRCNLRCSMCQLMAWTKPRRDMPFEDFKRIVAQFPGLARIKLQGMGEPLLNKAFFDMVRWARRRDIRVRTDTNGTLIDRVGARELATCGLEAIGVSVDSADPAVYNEIRRGADFHRVTDNVRALLAARNGRRRPLVRLRMVGMRRNVDGLRGMIGLTRELGADELTFQPNLNFYSKDEMEERIGGERLTYEEVEAAVRDGLAHARSTGVKLNVEIYDSPCRWPWKSCYISVDGFVVPCCHLADPDVMNFGNLLETPFREIWNGAGYRAFRAGLGRGPAPQCCRGCYAFLPETRRLKALLADMPR
jgi:pyrroloquinoline quinone biosynthesis protein E